MALIVPEQIPSAADALEAGISVEYKKNQYPLPADANNLRILILNLMPTKQVTESQFMRMIDRPDIRIDLTFLRTSTYISRNTDSEYLERFYCTFSEIEADTYDGLIITGAPVEKLRFSQVAYWEELCRIFEWSKTHVSSLYTVCWGAQAALHYFYGIEKQPLEKKLFGVFEHTLSHTGHPLLQGLEKKFYAPHSRHTSVTVLPEREKDGLEVLASSEKAGLHIAAAKDGSLVCVTGHFEYDRETLSLEYFRDVAKGDEIDFPENYFRNNNPSLLPEAYWQDFGRRFMKNWTGFLLSAKK